MGRIIGIDLGTTNSVVAAIGAGGCRIIQNREAEQQTRSIVGFYKGDYLVGSMALKRWPLAPKDTIVSIKRLMGRAVSDPEVEKMKRTYLYEIVEPSDGTRDSVCVKLGEKEFSPVDISAMILRKLKADAEFVLGEKVTHAVITVPAYFSDKQINATREAGIKAGLVVMKIIDEPTAAAVAYGIDSREQEAKTVLVYDLGGGTFDISILMMSAGAYAILDKEGDMWLGGDNFDQLIVDYVVKYIRNEYCVDPVKNTRFMAILKMEAQKAKEMLGAAVSAPILIAGILQDSSGNIIDVDLDITRECFERMAMPLVERTVSLSRKSVENAHLSLEDIDYVLMAGNSTCLPMVQQAMEKLFGSEKILRRIHPKNCVAMGAAMTAAVLGGIECPACKSLTTDLKAERCGKCGLPFSGLKQMKTCPACGEMNDIDARKCCNLKCGADFIKRDNIAGGNAPFAYGIQTAGDKFNGYIKKNDRYPTPEGKRKFQDYRTLYYNQRTVSIPVYGGDNFDKASSNQKMGEASIILPPYLPEGTIVRVMLWLNENGTFEIAAQLENGQDLDPEILRGTEKQRVKEKIDEIDSALMKNENKIPPDTRKELDEKYNEVIAKYKEEDLKSAYNEAERLVKEIEEAAKHPDGGGEGQLLQSAKGTSGYAKYIVQEYGWLIGPAAYSLNILITWLDEAVAKKDRDLVKAKMKELEDAIDSLLKDNELLNMFICIHLRILSEISPYDPVLANKLRDEMNSIEKMFRDHDSKASGTLNSFAERLLKILDDFEKKQNKGRICHICNYKNSPGTRKCSNCGAKLDVLISGNIRSSSSGNLWGGKI